MAAFDPNAATAAYMAQLSPEGHLKAIHYTQGGHWLLLWGWLVTVVVSLLILHSGILHRIRQRIDTSRRRPLAASFFVSVAFFLGSSLLSLPWTIYAQWWREKQYGLTSQPLGGFLVEALIGTVISVLFTGVFFVAVYALIRRAPRFWWAWAGAVSAAFVVFAMVIGPVAIEPLFNKYTPAPPGEVRDQVVALAVKAGVPHDKIYIYNGSKQSNRYTANVSGLFGTARVAMSDVMFAKGADLAEVRGVVGHEMGHYVLKHVLWGAAVVSLLSVLSFWLVSVLFTPVATLMRAHITTIADPAGLPVLIVIISTIGLLGTPVTNTLIRIQEAQADAFSLRVANEPDGLSKGLVKTIEYRASSPSWLEEFLFYDHPSVERRVHRAMVWKAAHMASANTPAPTSAPQ